MEDDQDAPVAHTSWEPRESRPWPMYLAAALGVAVLLSLSGLAWSVVGDHRGATDVAVNGDPIGPGVAGAASPTGSGPAGPRSPSGTPSRTSSQPPPGSRSTTRTASPSSAAPVESVGTLGTPVVVGTFTVDDTWLTGFTGQVSMHNTTRSAQSWRVVLIFPAGVTGYRSGSVSSGPGGFRSSRTGQTFTFTGDTRIPASGTTVLTFQFDKLGLDRTSYHPTACSVNDVRCEEG